jgi:uroporphyrinogen decarboxylase
MNERAKKIMPENNKSLLRALSGQVQATPPIWLMRQAGRYLPEYRQTRSKAGSFLDLVYNSDLACEVTMQPIRRYQFDAAILFADILVIPQALGQKLWFEENKGPCLTPIENKADFKKLSLNDLNKTLSPIYETIKKIRQELQKEGFEQTALIGFAGAPWTIACYMIEGGSSKNFEKVRTLAYEQPEFFSELIELITQATIFYLEKQIEAGAEIVQIFDSWAGVLEETQFYKWCIEPTKKIVKALAMTNANVPVIGFPKGAGALYKPYVQQTAIQGVGVDYQLPLAYIREELQPICTVQGNLDPLCLVAGGENQDIAIDRIVDMLSSGPFIFNLGHGIVKQTPPEHVERLVQKIRNKAHG